jgi:hypothetical protein
MVAKCIFFAPFSFLYCSSPVTNNRTQTSQGKFQLTPNICIWALPTVVHAFVSLRFFPITLSLLCFSVCGAQVLRLQALLLLPGDGASRRPQGRDEEDLQWKVGQGLRSLRQVKEKRVHHGVPEEQQGMPHKTAG